jgi:hypothetical protein
MARNRSLIALALVIGCGKSEPTREKNDPPPKNDDDKVETSPECAVKVAALASWLEKLELEQASHEIDFGYALQVIDREPVPLPRKTDVLIVKEKGFDGWDLQGDKMERLSIDGDVSRADLEAAVAAMIATKPDPADKELPPGDQIRFDIAPGALWSRVVRAVDAATKAGYTRALFAFTATSKLEVPLGVKPTYSDHREMEKASRRMEEIREKQCKPWDRAVMRHEWNPDREANARAAAKETADAIAACNCAADPDEVRVLKWIDAHWHQATIRVPVVVQLAGTTAKTITLGLGVPWSEAHVQLLEAAPGGAPPPVIDFIGN